MLKKYIRCYQRLQPLWACFLMLLSIQRNHMRGWGGGYRGSAPPPYSHSSWDASLSLLLGQHQCTASMPDINNWCVQHGWGEFRSCVKEEVAVLGSPSLTVCTVSVDVKQHWNKNVGELRHVSLSVHSQSNSSSLTDLSLAGKLNQQSL